MARWWQVPREWPGETCFIIGGGPSVDKEIAPTLKQYGRVIAINNAYTLVPEADVCFFADRRWFRWNAHDLHRFKGKYLVTRAGGINPLTDAERAQHSRIYRLKCAEKLDWLSPHPAAVGGRCGGGSSLNIAYLFGARRIVLLGYDMHDQNGHNWHTYHRAPPGRANCYAHYRMAIEAMAPALAKAGVEVLNASPGSALTCFPIVNIRDVL